MQATALLKSKVKAALERRTGTTLRRHQTALAQAFYHHGRLCASNQATVLVLVIVFVGIISYPGIITTYNSSSYGRQHHSTIKPFLPPSGLPHQPSSLTHAINAFWPHSAIAPTWSQDPAAFAQPFKPSDAPSRHYLAPIILNATNLGLTDLSRADLVLYAAHIQDRIQAITVEHPGRGRGHSSFHTQNRDTTVKDSDGTDASESKSGSGSVHTGSGTTLNSPLLPRQVSLRDICLLNPSLGSTGSPPRHCLIHSPLAYWRDNVDLFMADSNIPETIHHHQNSTSELFSPLSLFGGFLLENQTSSALVMSFFLRDNADPDLIQDHDQHPSPDEPPLDTLQVWHLILEKFLGELQREREICFSSKKVISTDTEEPNMESQGVPPSQPKVSTPPPFLIRTPSIASLSSQGGSTRLVSEEYTQPRTNISAEYWLLGMAYFVMFLYISLSVGRVDLVKSKYGLGVAAVATVFVSLIMSIGLCSVFGVTLTLMPWEILPFMIIVVGVENINILVHAVVETSMDLPVKERVGRGLGAVGVSITMTLVAELCLLVIGAMTTIPAVQEFCTFAIAAVIMDYLLQMTFFITVISIDIRRLELSDLSARPSVPPFRYPFGPRQLPPLQNAHPHSDKSTLFQSDFHQDKSSLFSLANFQLNQDGSSRLKHRRSESAISNTSNGEQKSSGKTAQKNPKGRVFTSIIMVGVMAYLGYIYGTTSQTVQDEQEPVVVSYWHIVSPKISSEFWTMIDPAHKNGYLEVQLPLVLTIVSPTMASAEGACASTLEADMTDCSSESEPSEEQQSSLNHRKESAEGSASQRQLDPRRPFKLLRNGLVFISLFALWLVRVFVIPSIVLAAAILLLLSYLLSPQRKLLVDLQWSFPFIVLPGDYQSKRKLMMQELLAQEAKERGQDPGPVIPLPGLVETLKVGGHETDIDQMDVSSNGLILTSSMDGTLLLWTGSGTLGRQVPLAQLEQPTSGATPTRKNSAVFELPPRKGSFSTQPNGQRSMSRAIKCLKLDQGGLWAAAGYMDGSIHVWGIDRLSSDHSASEASATSRLWPLHELVRPLGSAMDTSKTRVTNLCFWYPTVASPLEAPSKGMGPGQIMAGYRDGQIWEWCPAKGQGRCVIQTKHRGGITDFIMVELDPRTRLDLGLPSRAYLVTAGREGGLQCWSRSPASAKAEWSLHWSQPGLGSGVAVAVLSTNKEVPMVATGYSNGALMVWDLEHGNPVWTLSRGATTSQGPNQRSSRLALESHRPSHQGAITRLDFKSLELEDGLTGEPAPRVWLIVSSGVDEAIMVWMIEWEGLMRLPSLSTAARSSLPRSNSFLATTAEGAALGKGPFQPQAEAQGMLSSSLPAPRLVGYMRQRGGKSMAVGETCLYGVRRRESPTTLGPSAALRPKHAHTSVSDMAGPYSYGLRNKRKSEVHVLNPASNSSSFTLNTGHCGPNKRGWEVWEADLYQCIFKDPGVWGLDLTVRSIDLQPSVQSRPEVGLARSLSTRGFQVHTGVEPEPIMVNTNGSGMSVPVMQENDPSQPLSRSAAPRPKLQRRPGSFASQGGQQGYVYSSTSLPSTRPTEYSPDLYPTSSGRWDAGPLPLDLTSFGAEGNLEVLGGGDFGPVEHELLPFVETRHVFAVPRVMDPGQMEFGKGVETMDVVVSFGNWIKVVHVQSDEDDLLDLSALQDE